MQKTRYKITSLLTPVTNVEVTKTATSFFEYCFF